MYEEKLEEKYEHEFIRTLRRSCTICCDPIRQEQSREESDAKEKKRKTSCPDWDSDGAGAEFPSRHLWHIRTQSVKCQTWPSRYWQAESFFPKKLGLQNVFFTPICYSEFSKWQWSAHGKIFEEKTAVYRSIFFITSVTYCAGAVHLRKPRSTAVRITAVRKRRITSGPNRDLKSWCLPSTSDFAKQSDRTAVLPPPQTAVFLYLGNLLNNRGIEHRGLDTVSCTAVVIMHTAVWIPHKTAVVLHLDILLANRTPEHRLFQRCRVSRLSSPTPRCKHRIKPRFFSSSIFHKLTAL